MNIKQNIVKTKILKFSEGKLKKPRNYIKILSMKNILRLYPELDIGNNSRLNINNQRDNNNDFKN